MFKEVQGGCFIFFTESILSGICILGRYFFVTHKPIRLYYKIIYIEFNCNCIKENLFLGIYILGTHAGVFTFSEPFYLIVVVSINT